MSLKRLNSSCLVIDHQEDGMVMLVSPKHLVQTEMFNSFHNAVQKMPSTIIGRLHMTFGTDILCSPQDEL